MNQRVSAYFKTSDVEEIEEMYEQEIFELKQFFLARVPIAKLFKGRLAKLNKLQDAFERIEESVRSPHQTHIPAFSFPQQTDVIVDAYQAFQTVKNKIRLEISNELNGAKLIHLVQNLIDLEKHNAQQWSFDQELDEDDSVVVSKEPNPIDIQNAINEYLKSGGKTFQQLKRNENNPPNVLVQEMKRLSLLFKKY